MPNQLNNAEGIFLFYRDSIPFCTHRMNLIKMQILILWVISICFLRSWFGDYRSLRFLCDYFGSRTFYFIERDDYEKTRNWHIWKVSSPFFPNTYFSGRSLSAYMDSSDRLCRKIFIPCCCTRSFYPSRNVIFQRETHSPDHHFCSSLSFICLLH